MIELLRKRYIGGTEDPLVIRWILFRTPWCAVFLHKLCRSDYERALHDHPWPFVSIVLKGEYLEVVTENNAAIHRRRWSVAYRPAAWRHRVVLTREKINFRATTPRSELHVPYRPCWTLMLVGPRQRRWGFWVDGQFCWWRKHNPDLNICEDHVLHYGGQD